MTVARSGWFTLPQTPQNQDIDATPSAPRGFVRTIVRLCAEAIVRNEADLIEAFVRHNLTVVDHLAIVDHGSFDGTSEILSTLIKEDLPLEVTRDERVGFVQTERTSFSRPMTRFSLQ